MVKMSLNQEILFVVGNVAIVSNILTIYSLFLKLIFVLTLFFLHFRNYVQEAHKEM